jgi:hypothetical protein
MPVLRATPLPLPPLDSRPAGVCVCVCVWVCAGSCLFPSSQAAEVQEMLGRPVRHS